ncbi:unnamed protein product [Arabidopsis lyrata]|uniref:Uncharacterized protein n=1 Tax=Arabidopsis lyrata subsp. lyrata TaxID=81972 RepID=D7LUU7_ARALL|nr:uncharacterized protein LOC9312325 [Arabidopsis lyrata subsp. lyrata]EFH54242.1 hypothetical protein ARALYDRAFT_323986 [Arabidopsis lyrata subsp. lyrata]CAH8268605.1 unnamed protein product [Arabidopsis lyrata]|eukprot:XP_002877983.1 uncharacterized protein LOC9312325 [Arabidopsis lyrata subsp. lyrata]
MEASTQLNDVNKISNSIGIVGNYNEKGLGKLYRDKMSPDADPVVHMSVSKAEKRLKKLERDYQHTYENYIETRSNRYRFYIEAKHSTYRSQQVGNCIKYYKNLREQLQNNLDKLNKVEATQRGRERPDHWKQVSMIRGCKSLAQEKRILQQIGERQQHLENNDLGQETIHFTKISWEFDYSQSKIPKSSNSKAVHNLLRKFKDTEKLKDKAIANGDLVNNPTSQDILTISIEMELKLLTKVIKTLEKERGIETTRTDNGHEEKMRHLEKKCEWICGKWDEEKKYIVGLKNIHVS